MRTSRLLWAFAFSMFFANATMEEMGTPIFKVKQPQAWIGRPMLQVFR